MIDKDRLIKALEYCDEHYSCIGCPYSGLTSEKEIVKCKANHDAVILLRGQENLADRHDVLAKACDYLLAELKKRPEIIRKFKDMTTTMKPGELVITVEQRELVCCKDCKYGEHMCQPWSDIVCTQNRATHIPDWFCADGERR